MDGNICNIHQLHDVSKLKLRPTKVWHDQARDKV